MAGITQKRSVSASSSLDAAPPLATLKMMGEAVLGSIVGVVQSYKTEPSSFDPEKLQYRFSGLFRATKTSNGAVTQSNIAYLPGCIEVQVADEYDKALRDSGAGFAGLEIMLDVIVSPSARSGTGYAVSCRYYGEKKEADPLNLLMERFSAYKRGERLPPIEQSALPPVEAVAQPAEPVQPPAIAESAPPVQPPAMVEQAAPDQPPAKPAKGR